LAKEKEDEFLRREMRGDAVQQVLRRLASVGR
jgi:outer membrane lipopolysaccharide assembly protein LptE/RlpB